MLISHFKGSQVGTVFFYSGESQAFCFIQAFNWLDEIYLHWGGQSILFSLIYVNIAEEPGRLQSMGSLRVGHDWATSLSLFTFMHWRRKEQPTPVFLPGESQGRGSLVPAVYGVAQSWTQLKQLSSSSSRMQILISSKSRDTQNNVWLNIWYLVTQKNWHIKLTISALIWALVWVNTNIYQLQNNFYILGTMLKALHLSSYKG